MTPTDERNISDKSKRSWKVFYTVICFVGLLSILFETHIDDKTIVKTSILIGIILTVGLTAFFFNRKHYKSVYNKKGNFFPLMQNILSWGFLSCYIFMATNYYLADKTQTEYQFKIVSKGSIIRKKSNLEDPLVTINYFGLDKELDFHSADNAKVNDADSVKMTVRKGGLGYDIVENYDVF